MRGNIRTFWLALAVILAVLAVLLCVASVMMGSLYIRPTGEPQQTVIRFFDAVKSADYAEAYACLSDYQTLGLEGVPAAKDGQLLYQALQDSYDYTLSGDCRVEDLSAVQRVKFTYLNVGQAAKDAAAKVGDVLAVLIEERPREELADEEGNILPEVNEEAYLTALHQVLADPIHYTRSAELEISLSYDGTNWLITTSPALLSALIGGL